MHQLCQLFLVLPCIQEFQSPEAGLSSAEVSVRGMGAFPLGGRLVPAHSPPHPSLIPTGLIPRSAPERMKCHARAVLTTSFRFALWMKNIVRKPLFIF